VNTSPPSAAPSDPLLSEIVPILLELGGAAHCDMVLARLAERRGLEAIPDDLRQSAHRAFDLECRRQDVATKDQVVFRPFGESSRRWALTERARQLLQSRQSLQT
jgi:hypothetical protein